VNIQFRDHKNNTAATHCSVLQCVAAVRPTLQQHIAVHCNVLQHTAVGRYRVEGGGQVS